MKICVRCLTLQGDETADCPACGTGLVPYALWRKNQPPAMNPAPVPVQARPIPAMTTQPGTGAIKSKYDGVNIVLGVFLSSLAFFVAFLAAYIFVELKK
jgi:hypothetical protein